MKPVRTDRITLKPKDGDVKPGKIAIVEVSLLNDSKKGEDLEDATVKVELFDGTSTTSLKTKSITIQYINEDEEQSIPKSIKEHLPASQGTSFLPNRGITD